MSEFTKGPWVAEELEVYAVDGAMIGVVYGPDDFPCDTGSFSDTEAEANARLFAAAPTLLECLEDEVREMRARGHEPSERTLAAIAAAKGGSRE